MIVKRGSRGYQYKSIRENGEPKTIYQGKLSSQQLREHEARKEEKQQHRKREQEMEKLNQTVDQALSALDMMKRACLLMVGLYERRSEIRTLKGEAICHTTIN